MTPIELSVAFSREWIPCMNRDQDLGICRIPSPVPEVGRLPPPNTLGVSAYVLPRLR